MRRKYKNKFSIKWNLIWVIIHTISLFIIGFLLDYINIQNDFIQLLLLGFCITIFARIIKIFTAKKRFIVDKWLVFWSLLNAFTIGIGYFIIDIIELTNTSWNIILLAALLVLIANIIRRFRLPNKRLIVLSIIIISILLFSITGQSDNFFNKIISSGIQNSEKTEYGSKDYKGKISDIKENIKVKVDEITEELDPKSDKNIKEAFEELNQIREDHGVSKLRWDNNVYELVKFQASKGLCSTSHCDHKDSSGKYFDAYASRYKVSLMGHSAENIAGSTCHQAVIDLWLYSTTGHRENMLNPIMHKGALAYDKGNCILIVTS
jgi:uncharacterized protein YkwD